MLGVLSALGAADAPARRGHRRHRDGLLPARHRRPRVRARIRLQPRLHDAVRVGAHHRRRRAVDAVPDVRLRVGRARRRPPAAAARPARDRDARRLRRAGRLLLRVPAQSVVLAVHGRIPAARSRTCPALSFAVQLAPLPAVRRHDVARLGHRPRDHQLHLHPVDRTGRARRRSAVPRAGRRSGRPLHSSRKVRHEGRNLDR